MPKRQVKPKPVKVPERDVVQAVLRSFHGETDGVWLFRQNTGAFTIRKRGYTDQFVRFGTPGQSDVTGIVAAATCSVCGMVREGVRIELECKARHGKLTPGQERWLESMAKAGGITGVIRPEPSEYDPTGLMPKYLRRRILALIGRPCRKCRNESERLDRGGTGENHRENGGGSQGIRPKRHDAE